MTVSMFIIVAVNFKQTHHAYMHCAHACHPDFDQSSLHDPCSGIPFDTNAVRQRYINRTYQNVWQADIKQSFWRDPGVCVAWRVPLLRDHGSMHDSTGYRGDGRFNDCLVQWACMWDVLHQS